MAVTNGKNEQKLCFGLKDLGLHTFRILCPSTSLPIYSKIPESTLDQPKLSLLIVNRTILGSWIGSICFFLLFVVFLLRVFAS